MERKKKTYGMAIRICAFVWKKFQSAVLSTCWLPKSRSQRACQLMLIGVNRRRDQQGPMNYKPGTPVNWQYNVGVLHRREPEVAIMSSYQGRNSRPRQTRDLDSNIELFAGHDPSRVSLSRSEATERKYSDVLHQRATDIWIPSSIV